jgi:hypothetical protein
MSSPIPMLNPRTKIRKDGMTWVVMTPNGKL